MTDFVLKFTTFIYLDINSMLYVTENSQP